MKRPGAGVLVVAHDTGRVLLGKRSGRVSSPHTLAAFGGSAEKIDANPAQTALRELYEETGYRGPIRLEVAREVTEGRSVGLMFIGLVPFEFDPRLNLEHDAAGWVRPEALNSSIPMHHALAQTVSCEHCWHLMGQLLSGRL